MLPAFRTVLGRSRLPLLFAFGAVALSSFHFQSTAEARVRLRLAPSTRGEWVEASQQKVSATLQVEFPTFFAGADILSTLIRPISENFPGLKLNTLPRVLHSTFLYLDDLTLEEAQELARAFREASMHDLKKHGLLETVEVIDWAHVEIVRVGTQSVFLALKPHPSFVALQLRFYEWIRKATPRIFEKHLAHRNLGLEAMSPERIHISLVQMGEKVGIEKTDAEIEEIGRQLKAVIEREVARYTREHGKLPSTPFSLETHPLQLITPPPSLRESATTIFSLQVKAHKISLSKVVRWPLYEASSPDEIAPVEKYLEANFGDFMRPNFWKKFPIRSRTSQWLPHRPVREPLQVSEIQPQLNSRVSRAFETALKLLPESFLPSEVSTSGDKYYVPQETHTYLDPQKAARIFEKIDTLGFSGLNRQNIPLSVGTGIYASAIRSDIENPSDYDLMANLLVEVPDHIQTIEEAQTEAVKNVNAYFFGHLRKLMKQGKIAITELRIGSDATMGNLSDSLLRDLLENPYMSHDDFLKQRYRDKKGKEWTLEELLLRQDFIKFKIDLFTPEGQRIPLSLVTNVGIHWKGSTLFLQGRGLKGIPPLLRTSVYRDLNSYAIAASLYYQAAIVNSQRGSPLSSAIRDILDSAFKEEGDKEHFYWSSKLLKRVKNYLMLLAGSRLGLEHILVESALNQRAPNEFIGELIDRINLTINQPELAPINQLKQIVNNLYEWSERRQKMTKKQWTARAQEIPPLLSRIESLLLNRYKSTEGLNALREFRSLVLEMGSKRTIDQVNQLNFQASSYVKSKRLEHALAELESKLILESSSALPEDMARFIERFVRDLPDMYETYQKTRPQEGRRAENIRNFLVGARKKSGLSSLISHGCRIFF